MTGPALPLHPTEPFTAAQWDAMHVTSQAYADELAMQAIERAALARARQHRASVDKATA